MEDNNFLWFARQRFSFIWKEKSFLVEEVIDALLQMYYCKGLVALVQGSFMYEKKKIILEEEKTFR